MGRLAGKIAWVTGAGSGIGEAAALALAEEGATIVLTGRRRAPLEEVAGAHPRTRRHRACAAGRPDRADAVRRIGEFIKTRSAASTSW